VFCVNLFHIYVLLKKRQRKSNKHKLYHLIVDFAVLRGLGRGHSKDPENWSWCWWLDSVIVKISSQTVIDKPCKNHALLCEYLQFALDNLCSPNVNFKSCNTISEVPVIWRGQWIIWQVFFNVFLIGRVIVISTELCMNKKHYSFQHVVYSLYEYYLMPIIVAIMLVTVKFSFNEKGLCFYVECYDLVFTCLYRCRVIVYQFFMYLSLCSVLYELYMIEDKLQQALMIIVFCFCVLSSKASC